MHPGQRRCQNAHHAQRSTDTPKGIYITYNGTESIFIRNLDFEYAQIRNFGNRGFDMDNCSFKYANGKLNSSGAISIGKTGAMFRITNCTFSQNTVPAVGGAANMYCGLEMSNCSLYDNNTKNANKPQLNLTVGDNMPVILRNINITGTGRTKVGAIAISNLMGATAPTKSSSTASTSAATAMASPLWVLSHSLSRTVISTTTLTTRTP